MSDTPRTDARIAKFYCPEFPGDLYKNGNKEEFNRGRDWYFFQMVEFAKELERELSKPQPEARAIIPRIPTPPMLKAFRPGYNSVKGPYGDERYYLSEDELAYIWTTMYDASLPQRGRSEEEK